jgi:hypothetical protein
VSRQIALPDTGSAGRMQNRVNPAHRKRPRDHTQADEIRDPAARRKRCNSARHLPAPDSWSSQGRPDVVNK